MCGEDFFEAAKKLDDYILKIDNKNEKVLRYSLEKRPINAE